MQKPPKDAKMSQEEAIKRLSQILELESDDQEEKKSESNDYIPLQKAKMKPPMQHISNKNVNGSSNDRQVSFRGSMLSLVESN